MNKFLYWFVTAPARYLAAIGGLVVVLLLLSTVFLIGRVGASAPATPTPIVAAENTPVGPGVPANPPEGEPTATVVVGSGFGSTINVSDWTISLARMEMRQCAVFQNSDGTTKIDKQPHYLVWVDAKNNAAEARTLRRTIGWSLRTNEDHVYYARPDQDADTGQVGAWVAAEGRDLLSVEVPPGGVTHPLLAFRTFNFTPLQLVVSTVAASPETYAFDLLNGPNPTQPVPTTGCE